MTFTNIIGKIKSESTYYYEYVMLIKESGKMEYEVRFYYGSEELEKILENLRRESDLKEQPRTYEKTTQYNHSDERFDF